MPRHNYIRLRLIEIIRANAPIVRRTILRKFNTSDRPQANNELSLLLSEGFAHTIGRGIKGNPETIILGASWPADLCPLCRQTIYRDIR